MNPSALKSKILRLKEAGKLTAAELREIQANAYTYGAAKTAWEHAAAVEQAATEALAELEKLKPKYDCRKCKRDACPHSGRWPKRPRPPDGCVSFKETP